MARRLSALQALGHSTRTRIPLLTKAMAVGLTGVMVAGASAGASPQRPTDPNAEALALHSPWARATIDGGDPAAPNLYSVTAINAKDAWSVGLGNGVVMSQHWDGESWTFGHTGIPGGSLSSSFYGVSADASNDVWAVGSFNSTASHRSSLAAHWDGKTWTLMHTADPVGGLYGVDVLTPDDVWAVGGYADDTGTIHPAVEHWDGSKWSNVDTPDVDNASLGSISAVTATDIWAVGSRSDDAGDTSPFIEHWDGTAWSVVDGAPPGGPNLSPLLGVSAVSSNDVWAVGAYFDSNFDLQTYTEHWNGNRWKRVASPNSKVGSTELTAVTAISTKDVWAVGNVLPGDGSVTLTMHWDGSRWTTVKSPSPKGFQAILVAAAAVDSDDVWAVGYGVDNENPFASVSLIEHWNGSRWQRVKSPNP